MRILLAAALLCLLAGCGRSGLPAVASCEDNEQTVATALGQYATDAGGVYPHRLEQLVPKYLKALPTCPAAGRDTYSSSYEAWQSRRREPGGPRTAYTFFCSGRHHADAGLAPDRPRCTSASGIEK